MVNKKEINEFIQRLITSKNGEWNEDTWSRILSNDYGYDFQDFEESSGRLLTCDLNNAEDEDERETIRQSFYKDLANLNMHSRYVKEIKNTMEYIKDLKMNQLNLKLK